MQDIKFVISLGSSCFTSYLLKDVHLKLFSCPFDWIFSSPEMIQDCIDDNFLKFMDKSLYTNYLSNQSSATHRYYGKAFLHHDPRNETHSNYFQRCVNRFNKVLLSPMHKLFVISLVNIPAYCETTDYIVLHNYLKSKTDNFKMLILVHILTNNKELPNIVEFEDYTIKYIFVEERLCNYKFETDEYNQLFRDCLTESEALTFNLTNV